MGLYFRKRIKICNGVSLNLSKKGLGLSMGVKGCRVSVNSNGQKQLNIGANGVYYRKTISAPKKNNSAPMQNEKLDMPSAQFFGLLFLFSMFVLFIISCFVG